MHIRAIISCLLIILLSACGGGSGSSDSGGYAIDACPSIGLKVAQGRTCSVATGNSALVALRIASPTGSVGLCSGAAIGPRTVLTAAHCFLNGASAIAIDTVGGSIAAVSYTVAATFQIQGQVVFDDAAVVSAAEDLGTPILPLLTSRSAVVGEEAVVAGYGYDRDGGNSGVLHAGNAFIASVSPNHIFLEYSGDQAHPCAGDSGAPLLVAQGGALALAGIVSQSDPAAGPACRRGDITLYTNTQKPSVLEFIRSQIPSVAEL